MHNNVYSDLKIFNFPEKVASFRAGTITAPLYVRIKPTNRCSHACHWCTYSDGTKRPKDVFAEHLQTGMHGDMRERDVMPTAKAFELLDDLGDMGTNAVTFSGGGEPLMHPDIVPIMQRTCVNAIDLSIITNGQALSGANSETLSNAKWVRVSMDYTNAAGMAASRHVPERMFEQVMENIKNFAAQKSRTCDLGINFIVTRENHEHLCSFAATLKETGVENVRFAPVYVQNFQQYHAPIAARVRDQLQEIQTFTDANFSVNSTYVLDHPGKLPERPFARCFYAQTVPVVGADLNVYPCHNQAYSAMARIGSIAHQRFSQMWFSDETKRWFEAFNPSVSCTGIECANHMKVALFNQLAEMSVDNFV